LAGRTPREAVENFLAPIRKAVAFVTSEVLFASGSELSGGPHYVTFRQSPARLSGPDGIGLTFAHYYNVIQTSEPLRGPYRVHTAGYEYEFFSREGISIIAYHWHPTGQSHITWPHIHLPKAEVFDFSKVHPPTGRISVEAALRFAITDLGVVPRRGKWQQQFDRSERVFREFRTWG
jgi:hypothetical protein